MRSSFLAPGVFVLLLIASAPARAQHAISTVAGGGPNNLAALSSSIGQPYDVGRDGAGNFYIADIFSPRIFKVNPAGNLTIVAGNGVSGYSGDGGPATRAVLSAPIGMSVDGAGNIFIADISNQRIREVAAATGLINTVAGNGTLGYSGDGGPATSAELNQPSDVFVDGFGNLFIADLGNSRIREVVAATGIIQTVAGNGVSGYSGDGGPATSAQLSYPTGIFVDSAGDIFFADSRNERVREVVAATGAIRTVAGNGTAGYSGDGGPATSAEIDLFSTYGVLGGDVLVDGAGNILVADSNNHRIREVAAATGVINTIAGNGTPGYSGDGGPATSAELDLPVGLSVDGLGNLFIADLGNSRIREAVAGTGIIQTVAGNGTLGYAGDGGLATNAALFDPSDVSVDAAGNIFIADYGNHRVREVVAATGVIKTVAGNGTAGYSGDGGPATSAELSGPAYVFVDSFGNLFISDTGNARIREVVAATGIIQTVAGDGTFGYSGDGGLATSAELRLSFGEFFQYGGIFVDSAGNLFISDTGNSRIREVVARTGIIQTVAGNGIPDYSGDGGPATSAGIEFPAGVFVDGSGNIFFATFALGGGVIGGPVPEASRIREVVAATGLIQTIAGNGGYGYGGDGGLAINAVLAAASVFVDGLGNIFIADLDNGRVREVAAATGVIQTVAGNGVYGASGDGGPATSAELAGPSGLAADSAGDLLIADSESGRIRSVSRLITILPWSLTPGILSFGNQPVGTSSSAQSATFKNTGSTALTISSIGVTGANSADFTQTNTCPASGSSLAAGAECTISITFIPTATGSRSAAITIADNAIGSPQSVSLTGVGTNLPWSLAPGVLSFSNQLVGTSSGAESATFTNTGSAALTISSIGVTGANSGDFTQTNTCPASGSSLAAGAECTISVTFMPTATGSRSAAITIADNAIGSPQSVSLTGVGTDFALAAATGGNCPQGGNCSTSAIVSAGQTATYNLQVSPLGGFNGTVALTCSGAPAASVCSVSPASVPPPGNYAFTVTVGNASTAFVRPWVKFPLAPMLAALCFALPLLLTLLRILFSWKGAARGRAVKTLWPALAVLLIAVMLSSSCGGGGGRPSTSATLTITGASGSVKHDLSLSLTVDH